MDSTLKTLIVALTAIRDQADSVLRRIDRRQNHDPLEDGGRFLPLPPDFAWRLPWKDIKEAGDEAGYMGVRFNFF